MYVCCVCVHTQVYTSVHPCLTVLHIFVQGQAFKVPMVDRKPLDMATLFKVCMVWWCYWWRVWCDGAISGGCAVVWCGVVVLLMKGVA